MLFDLCLKMVNCIQSFWCTVQVSISRYCFAIANTFWWRVQKYRFFRRYIVFLLEYDNLNYKYSVRHLLLSCSAFFSASETALFSTPRERILFIRKKKNIRWLYLFAKKRAANTASDTLKFICKYYARRLIDNILGYCCWITQHWYHWVI